MYTLDVIVITMNMLTDIPSGVHIPAHNINEEYNMCLFVHIFTQS